METSERMVFSQRRDGADAGPVHAEHHSGQAWCGVQTQFRHWRRPAPDDAVTCRRCLTALDRGRPFARGSR